VHLKLYAFVASTYNDGNTDHEPKRLDLFMFNVVCT